MSYSVWYCHTVYGTVIQCMVLSYSVWYCHTVYGTVIQCMVLSYSVWYCHTVYDGTLPSILTPITPVYVIQSMHCCVYSTPSIRGTHRCIYIRVCNHEEMMMKIKDRTRKFCDEGPVQ